MTEWLTTPAAQAGVVPFIVALLSAALLRKAGWYWAGGALVAGFAVAVYLSVGFQFQPWTSTRKIVALILGAAAVGLLYDLYPYQRRWLIPITAAAAIAAVWWVVWPVLSRSAGLEFWLLAAGISVYTAWCAVMMDALRAKPVALSGAAVALGFGAGITALLGASALLGQWGIALGVSAGALWLFVTFTRNTAIGSLAALPLGAGAALIGCAAAVYAKLPWTSLAILALIPLAARLFWFPRLPRLAQAALSMLVTAALAAAAVWFTLQRTGAPPL